MIYANDRNGDEVDNCRDHGEVDGGKRRAFINHSGGLDMTEQRNRLTRAMSLARPSLHIRRSGDGMIKESRLECKLTGSQYPSPRRPWSVRGPRHPIRGPSKFVPFNGWTLSGHEAQGPVIVNRHVKRTSEAHMTRSAHMIRLLGGKSPGRGPSQTPGFRVLNRPSSPGARDTRWLLVIMRLGKSGRNSA